MKKKIILALTVLFCIGNIAKAEGQGNAEVPGMLEMTKELPAEGQEANSGRWQRPKIGLVLSGGGAKGASHIGVLRFLKEMDIPVDYVVGTSMGSIMGAMYAIGYTPEEMQKIILDADWTYYMTDEVERSRMSYREKMRADQFPVKLSFGKEEIKDPLSLAKIREEVESNHKDAFTGLIPSGVISGNNILTLFNTVCMGYTEEMDFSKLPIPFACVSTNIIDGTENVHRNGKLPEAIRASMAIPGVFSPVYTESKVLVDGGIRNNFPADLVREMGADIIIGVNLAIEKEKNPEKLRSVVAQMRQLLKIITGNNLSENNELCDILVTPDVSAYTSLDFNTKDLTDIIEIGYNEAKKHKAEFKELHDLLKGYGSTRQTYQAPKAYNLIGNQFKLTQIQMEGLSNESDIMWLIKKSGLKIGEETSLQDLNDAVSTYYGLGIYSNVQYKLEKDVLEDGYIVKFNLETDKPHTLNASVRVDTHDAVQMKLRLGLNQAVLHGIKTDLIANLSYNPTFSVDVACVLKDAPRFGLLVEAGKRDADLYYWGELSEKIREQRYDASLYMSEYTFRDWHFRAGSKFTSAHFPRVLSNYYTLELGQGLKPMNILGLFAEANFDNLEDSNFPESGFKAHFDVYQNLWHFREAMTQFKPYSSWRVNLAGYFKLAEKFTLIPQVHLALTYDKNCHWEKEEIPVSYDQDMALSFYPIYQNKVGGPFSDFEFKGQVPFAGSYSTEMADEIMVLRSDFRYNLLPGHYLTLKMNYGRVATWDTLFSDTFTDSFGNSYTMSGLNRFGVALEYAINTLLGPISAEVGWNSFSHRVGVFISLGRYF